MFKSVCSRERLQEFIVINIDNVDFNFETSRAAARQKFKMVQIEVQRAEDYGQSDKTFIVNSHLGEFINYNDTLLGYDLNAVNLSDLEDFENLKGNKVSLPDCVMVRKCFPKVRKAQRKRIWKLKHMEKQALDENNIWVDKKKSKKNQDQEEGQKNKDYQMFLNDIEEDADIRQNVNLYKDDDVIGELEKQLAGLALDDKKPEASVEKSSVAQALDKGQATVNGKERKVVKVARKTAAGKAQQGDAEDRRVKDKALFKATLKKKPEDEDSGWESVEEDFPIVKLEELLENLKLDDGPKIGADSDDEEEKKGM